MNVRFSILRSKPARRRSASRVGARGGALSRSALTENANGYLTCFVLLACILLGGATRNGGIADVILQLLSVILLIVAARKLADSGDAKTLKWPLIFVAAIVLVPCLQLLPLPLSVWALLPGRLLISETYRLIEQPQPATPLTVTPDSTWLSMLSLLPPIAIFLSVVALRRTERRALGLVVITAAVSSVFLGLIQIAQGPQSAYRFYAITNSTEAVGFFANRNHFAALLYVATLFIAAHVIEVIIAAGQTPLGKRVQVRSIVPLVAWPTLLVIVLAGEMMARSRTGLMLTALALLASVGAGMSDARLKMIRPAVGKTVVGITVAILIFFAPLALYRIFDRFESDLSTDVRIPFARNTISAALTYMPFGSGVGSFVSVYQTVEQPSDIRLEYANHAHDDLLEVWLESGIFGLALIGVFGAWLLRRALPLWFGGGHGDLGTDRSLQRSASLALLLLLMHSLVDYPLRTTAMMAIAALSAGFLFPPSARRDERHRARAASTYSPRGISGPVQQLNTVA